MSLTEDFELQVEATCEGKRILWNNNVRIYDEKPTYWRASLRQRIRWAQGHWFVCFKNTRRIFSALREKRISFGEFLSTFFYVYSLTPFIIMKPDQAQTWEDMRRFPVHKQFMIHALIYRTQLLRDIPLALPEHTFYEDNLYIYQPLPYTKTVYYLDAPLYGYFIGRADQSIAEENILRRLDQVSLITEQVATTYTFAQLKALPKTLCGYMLALLCSRLILAE